MIPEEGYFGGWGPMLFISGAGMLILAFILFVFRAWWRKYFLF